MHIAKKGLRVLGIAESFTGRTGSSTIAGVVMRKDQRIDGFEFETVTVGGMDATEAVIRLFFSLKRRDINVIMLSGCVIAWYNIIDPAAVSRATGLPVIAVTYDDSEGLEDNIAFHFPGDAERLDAYMRLGDRLPVDLGTGFRIYLRSCGMTGEDAARLCDAFTYDGRVPEPLHLARFLARAFMRRTRGGT